MTYEEYYRIAQQADQAVKSQDFETAIGLLSGLVQSDLPDLDKSVMCINLSIVWDKRGNQHEAFRWLDKAIHYEKPHKRFYAQEEKAAGLLRLGRKEEAGTVYRELLAQSFLSMSDRQRIESNLKLAD